jgi:uncharacterized protein YndB with AHSA1/START domain
MDEKNKSALTLTFPSDLEILMTRSFDAPRRLVFDAYTKPEHLVHWWGLRGSTMSVCEVDCRPGGAWRFVVRSADGREDRFSGVYREVVAPERLVSTERYDEPAAGYPEWLSTTTFEERDGKTTVTSRILHTSVQNRDGHLGSGMERGANECLNRLVEYLEAVGQTVSPALRQ